MKKQQRTHRQAQKEDTRRIILNSAYALFARDGYPKTTMRALATHAGVGLGTIFQHFQDKPSLLVAAFQEDLNKVIVEAFSTLPASDLKKQLLHITEKIFAFYAGNQNFSRTLIKEVLFLEGEYGETLNAQIEIFLNNISSLIRISAENGEIPDMDAEAGALAFWSFYFTVLLMGLKQPSFYVESHLELIDTLIEHHFFRR